MLLTSSVTLGDQAITAILASEAEERSMDENRILDKLDSIETQSTQMLVGLTRLEEQIKDMPDLKTRVRALEQWRWIVVGALAAGGGSLATQLATAFKAAG